MSQVIVHTGSYRGRPVSEVAFTLIKEYTPSAAGGFVTVDSNGYFGPEFTVVRIRVPSTEAFTIVDDGTQPILQTRQLVSAVAAAVEPAVVESDEAVIKRIGDRFKMLDEMTRAAISGDVRAMIVVGPPGVGKSYGVEYQLEKAGLFDILGERKPRYEIVKGAMTALGLYSTLYKYSDAKNVLVFDDCDSILLDDLSLNILKAALDSGKKRRIHWNSDSHMLRREGVPDCFDFKGSIIFITNLKFENLRSKKLQDHLEALQSRCHFLDLTMNTMRDRFLRIKQIFNEGNLFLDYNLTPEEGEEILQFMDQNKNRLREMSLRMALKIADLTKVSKTNWRVLAESTCMRNE